MLARLRHLLQRIGSAGVIGVGLIIFASVFYLSAVVPMGDQLVELRRGVDRLQRKAQIARGSLELSDAHGGDQMQRFYSAFGGISAVHAQLGRIYAVAGDRGLELEAGEYKLVKDKVLKLVRYEITLPVKGNYPQIRGFVADVLNAVPTSTLDEVSLKRDKVGDEALDTRLRFSLLFGIAP